MQVYRIIIHASFGGSSIIWNIFRKILIFSFDLDRVSDILLTKQSKYTSHHIRSIWTVKNQENVTFTNTAFKLYDFTTASVWSAMRQMFITFKKKVNLLELALLALTTASFTDLLWYSLFCLRAHRSVLPLQSDLLHSQTN